MDSAALRNFRDFLLQYNRVSETCFLHCVDHLSDRELSQDEARCVDLCTRKHVNVNHKVMQVYMELQPLIMNKRIEEVNKQQAAAVEDARKVQEIEDSKKSALAEKGSSDDIGRLKQSENESKNSENSVSELSVRT